MIIGGTRPSEAEVRDSRAGYHEFHTETGNTYGSFEVFWDDAGTVNGQDRNFDGEGDPVAPGWYWWACFPGCMPDGEASGPFCSSIDAHLDADEWHPDNEEG